MAAAVVGDDVMREDPTVQALEDKAARLLGKEAGLLVPSGTMGNLISLLVHCNDRGAEYIVGDQAHIYYYEQGGGAQFGGAHPRVVPTSADGTLPLAAITAAIRTDDVHFPVTKVVCLGAAAAPAPAPAPEPAPAPQRTCSRRAGFRRRRFAGRCVQKTRTTAVVAASCRRRTSTRSACWRTSTISSSTLTVPAFSTPPRR